MNTRKAMFANESTQSADGTYYVGAAVENEAGYTVVNEGWPSLQQAQQYADTYNTDHGIDAETARMIVASSIAAGPVGF